MGQKSGKTLWQIFKEKRKQGQTVAELQVFNPLGAQIGDFVAIDHPNWANQHLTVAEIDVYERAEGRRVFRFVDYLLREGDNWVTLRVNPIADPDSFAEQHSHLLVLLLDYESDYNEGLHKEILPTGALEVTNNESQEKVTYQRLNSAATPFQARLQIFKDHDQSAEVEELEYWDFGRKTADGTEEFYFVEINQETGWIQMLKGFEISERDVMLLSTRAKNS